MLEFKSTEDLSKLSPDDPAFPMVEDLVKQLITDYIAEGYLTLVHINRLLKRPLSTPPNTCFCNKSPRRLNPLKATGTRLRDHHF